MRSQTPSPAAAPAPLFACLYGPSGSDDVHRALLAIAQAFSSRYERHRDALVLVDVSGLERLVGSPRTIGEELLREAAARGVPVHVALAPTRAAALVLALARPGLTVAERGRTRAALAPLPVGVLAACDVFTPEAFATLTRWGLKTLGEIAALPPAALASRLGPSASVWQALARGEDVVPLVPTLSEERFEWSLDLDWPIEGAEPLSFVLTRLLEPLSMRLERRDRGAAVVHLELGLVTRAIHARALQLPSPIRDPRTLRTLLLLDLESHLPPAAIDRVTVRIEPTPGRVVQHTLFTRAQPTPEQIATLLARLTALMGHTRIGAPSTVDSYRPGAFAMAPFAPGPDDRPDNRTRGGRQAGLAARAAGDVVSAWRRCRQPVPARVTVNHGRPVRVTTDRPGYAGAAVVGCVGPWRSSGYWWADGSAAGHQTTWNREEWEVALADGAVYRIFEDRDTTGWFVDAIAD